MATVRWTVGAQEDFDRIIHSFRSPSSARQFRDAVDVAVLRLERFPLSGRVIPELAMPELREVVLGSFRLLYVCIDEQIEVYGLINAHRDLRQLIARIWRRN